MSDKSNADGPPMKVISGRVGEEISDELRRTANIIASFHDKNRDQMPPNVSHALEREMARLRRLADLVRPDRVDANEEE